MQGMDVARRGTKRGHSYELLSYDQGPKSLFEPFLITLDETAKAFPIFEHDGVEFLYMLSGEVVYAHGDKIYVMEPGDSLFFDANIAHGPLELRKLPAIYLSIIVTPGD